MKKGTIFLLLLLLSSWTFKASAQTFTTSVDSLVATYEIKNKKALAVHPNTVTAKTYAQKNASDLLYVLDNFFATDRYRKAQSIKATHYLVTAKLSEQNADVDSFLSVVYLLELPGATTYSKQLKPGIFLPVKSGPAKIPEQFYISLLENQRLLLVSIRSSMYREEAAAARRKERVKAYLDWLREKYQ